VLCLPPASLDDILVRVQDHGVVVRVPPNQGAPENLEADTMPPFEIRQNPFARDQESGSWRDFFPKIVQCGANIALETAEMTLEPLKRLYLRNSKLIRGG